MKGNILFTNDGKSIVSPVGNRVTIYDLKMNKNFTIETGNRQDIRHLALAHDDTLLITVDREGHSVCTSLSMRLPIHHFNFGSPVKKIIFSPDGKYIAAALEDHVKVFFTPASHPQFRPIVLLKRLTGFTNKITTLSWSDDSKLLCVGSRDSTIRIHAIEDDGFSPILLRNHKNPIISTYFEKDSYNIFCADKSGSLVKWNYKSDDIFWKKGDKVCLRVENCHLVSCAYEKYTNIVALAFDNGVFSLYEYDTLSQIHRISTGAKKIDCIVLSRHTSWVAYAVAACNQLAVWEYKTESYVMKQQGHNFNMQCIDHSPDGSFIATGSTDGAVKIWNSISGFCIVTFSEHTATISSVKVSHSGNFVLSSSFDGTCRAFDLNRYRNFRVFVTPDPLQFACIDIDCSDEIVCASAVDNFNIYVWSMLTGRLLDILSGHTSMVSRITFIPNSSKLVSCSWDQSVKVWDVLTSNASQISTLLTSDCVYLCAHPFENIVAILTTRAYIVFWNHEQNKIIATIEGLRDLGLVRGINDAVCAESSVKFKYFTSAAFSADGELLIACGKSKYICLYDTKTHILIKRIQTSKNLSLDGILVRLNSSKMTEAGPLSLMENLESEDEENYDEISKIKVPGSLKHDVTIRKTKPELAIHGVSFSPTAGSFSCVSTEGLLTYSKDEQLYFNPINLSTKVTSDQVLELLASNQAEEALLASLSLGELDIIVECIEKIPYTNIDFVVRSLSVYCCYQILIIVVDKLDYQSRHFEFYLRWCNSILLNHGLDFKNKPFIEPTKWMPLIRKTQKVLRNYNKSILRLYFRVIIIRCESNTFTIKNIISQMDTKVKEGNFSPKVDSIV